MKLATEEPVMGRMLEFRGIKSCPTCLELTLDNLKRGRIMSKMGKRIHRLRVENKRLKKEVIAYCRGPHCVLAFDAVEKLRQQGFKASRLEDGFPEWKTAGLPVEKQD